uniref:Inhibitor of growth protein n=1 Tax=Meloidogyne enterolobii TaxID=390850 RepID=A0A6V7TXH6_MELEN|nr:unnamed protein product [Meloidogyne enterolobii]
MHYLEDLVELLGFLPAEMKKKCAELRELDFQYQAKMEKLGVDSEQLIEAYPTLTATESEKKNKELEQRYNEAQLIADSKVHITEYLQSVLEKYNEKVVKDLTDFKTELEIENPGEVDLIEKAFIQSITNPQQPPTASNIINSTTTTSSNLIFFDEDSSLSCDTVHNLQIEGQQQSTNSPNTHLNGNDIIDVTPKNVNIQRIKQQTTTTTAYEDFKIPANFRRPSQSVDSRPSTTTTTTTINTAGILGRLQDDDIFDNEVSTSSPPVKKHKTSVPNLRQISTTEAATTTITTTNIAASKRSRECSPRSSISSISPRSTSPSTSTTILPHALSKFQFPPSRLASMERWNAAFKQSTSSQPDQTTTSTTSTTSHQTRQQSIGLLRMPSFAGTQPSRHGRQRKLTKRVVQMLNESMPKPPEHGPALIRQQQEKIRRRQRRGGGGKDDNVEEEGGGGEVADEDEGEESFDEADEEGEEETDDRAWCYCKQGSAGNMVACDSKNCPYEWFHYECVGITQPPKGRWYCPTCSMKLSSAMRSRSASSEQQRDNK